MVVGGDEHPVAGPVLAAPRSPVAGGDGVRAESPGVEEPRAGGDVEVGDVDPA